MERGYQLFIVVLNCLFLKLILANYAQLNYNSVEGKNIFVFSTPYNALDILRFQIYLLVNIYIFFTNMHTVGYN